MKYVLETIAFNIESCRIAEENGAARIELCANPAEGGTTPSGGFIQAARKAVDIDVYPIIRPRGGDFLYSDEEFEIMQDDVRACKREGCDGVVIGMLNADGSIDRQRCTKLVSLAYPMGVTFHRAFDRVADPMHALEDVINIGCERILTSGLHSTAEEGKEMIKGLIEAADRRIIIMPGSGVRANNIAELANFTGATEFHSSARVTQLSGMQFQNKTMNENLTDVTIDGDEVKNLIAAVQKVFA